MKAVVIGAGVGGLSAALGLVREGVEVLVLERAPHVGGKMREQVVGGLGLDVGPTVLTMRWVFEELFASLGEALEAWVPLVHAELLARHAFEDGSVLDLYTDLERSAQAIAAWAGPREADGYRAFSDYARRIYEEVEAPFLRGERPTLAGIVSTYGLSGLGRLARIDASRSMWRALSSYFRDPRLIQLFGRYATYSGSSPLSAPATLNLIAHVERSGVSYVQGGMARLAEGLERLLVARGGQVRTGAMVEAIEVEGGAVRAVRLVGGERIETRVVVANCDVAALARGDLGPGVRRGLSAPREPERSLSALTWALAAQTSGFPLVRHNVFFSSDYRRELTEIFAEQRAPSTPTVYVCAQDRGDTEVSLARPERVFVLTCAPARDRPWAPEEIEQCEHQTFERLARAGLRLEVVARQRTTPEDFDRAFPATRGALYGRASTGMMAPFSREGARSPTPGLYLTGGSVHPGAGVPMVALSGRIAAATVIADHPSIARSPTAATRGGTPTSSATMASSA